MVPPDGRGLAGSGRGLTGSGRGHGEWAGRKCDGAGRKLAEVVPVSAAMSFSWPWQYSFPPFFT